MKFIPAKEYNYAHGKHPSILLDIENLGYEQVTDIMNPREIAKVQDNILYINTWIGRDSRYVLPGIGCTVEMLHRMHNDQFQWMFGTRPFIRETIDYIPDIDYSKYITEYIDDALKFDTRKKVYISNGPVQSCQAENFDFNPIIDSITDMYPDILFLVSQDMGLSSKRNMYYTVDVVGENYQGFDLNQVSYISTFCDILIGRNSGPHVFSQVRRNWNDPSKKLLSFTYTQIGSTFVLTEMPMKKYWSGRTDYQGVLDTIKEIIDG